MAKYILNTTPREPTAQEISEFFNYSGNQIVANNTDLSDMVAYNVNKIGELDFSLDGLRSSAYIFKETNFGGQVYQKGWYNINTSTMVITPITPPTEIEIPQIQIHSQSYFNELLREKPTITDLTGTKWELKEAPVIINSSFNISFNSNNQSFNKMIIQQAVPQQGISPLIKYNNTTVYDGFSATLWVNQVYRTISITGGTDATNANLISWIGTNATQILPVGDTKPVFKRVNNAWVKQDAFERVSGKWERISTKEPPKPTAWVYGVSGLNSSTPQLTRTDDAIGKTWSWSGTEFNSAINTDFDTDFNFERITDADGNVFIRIPKMYRKWDGGDVMRISNAQVDSTYLPYSCFMKEDGTYADYVDIGAYKGSVSGDKLQSKSGVAFTSGQTIVQFRAFARANTVSGFRYQQKDFHIRQMLIDLFMIVFATRKTEDVVGTEWKVWYGTKKCGDTDILNNNTLANPLSCCGRVGNSGGFKFFGIEDIVGYAYEFVDGIYFNNSDIYIENKPSEYNDNITNYSKLSFNRTNTSDFVTKLGYDNNNPFINYPSQASGGSYDTYYCDKIFSNGTILNDGAGTQYNDYGMFFYDGNKNVDTSNGSIGSRLCRRLI